MGNCLGPSSNLNRGLRSVTSVFSRNRSVAEEKRLPPPDGQNKDKAAAENGPTLKPPGPVPKPGSEPDAAGGTQTKPPKPVPKPATQPEAAEPNPPKPGTEPEAKPHVAGAAAEPKPLDGGGGAESKPPKPDTVGTQAKPPVPVSKPGSESDEDAQGKPHDPSPRVGNESPPSSPETPPQPEPELHSYLLPMPDSVPKPGTESPPSTETTQQPEPEFHSHSLPMPGQVPKSPPSPESPPQLGPEGHSYSLPMPGLFRTESPPSPESPPQLGPEGHSYSLPMPGQFRTESPPSPKSPPQLGPEGHSYSLPMPGQFRTESPPSPESPPQLRPEGHSYSLPMPGQFRTESPPSPESPPQLRPEGHSYSLPMPGQVPEPGTESPPQPEPAGHSYSLPMPGSSPKPSSKSPPSPEALPKHEVDSYSLPMPEGHSYSLPMPEAQSYSLPLPEGLSYSLPMPPEAQSYSLPMPEGQSYSLPLPPQLHVNVSPKSEAAKSEEPYRPVEVVEDTNKPDVPPKNKAIMKRLASVGLQTDSVVGRKTENLKDHYSMGRKLGQGQFGTTYVCLSKRTGNEFACKSIAKRKLITKEDVDDVRREIQIMHHLAGHQNVIQIVGAYEDAVEVHLVMELCEGGELFDRIIERGHYTERKAAELARVICCVVQTCHSLGVMHRDLKPENFLFVSQEEEALLKSIDFGLSIFFRPGEIFHDVVGSPYYVAPEVLQKHYGPECDIWSAGVIIYILLSGVPPFWDETEQGIFEQVLRGDVDYISDPWPYISDSGKELIQKMLDRDPTKRPTALEVLHHPWVQPDGDAPDTPLDSAVLGRLEQFSRMTKLKKIAIRVISENLSEEEIAGLKAMFKSMDTDGSGNITLEELKYGLKKVGSEIKDSELKGLMQAADVDNSGCIDYGEFVAAMLHLNKVQKEDHLYAAFSYFDKDGSGYITKDEVQLACQGFGLENLQLDDIVREVDQDNDGRIDYNEFVAMMQDTGLVQKK